MNNFDDAFTAVMGNEGGYSFNPADPGGETMWGVTKIVATHYGYTGPMKDLPQSTAKTIAKKAYWDTLSLDSLNINVAFQVFDAGYNHGQSTAVKWLQSVVGTSQDGIIGPMTIAAANKMPWYKVVFEFVSIRTKFYTGLNTWSTFGKGWTNRIANNLKIASQG